MSDTKTFAELWGEYTPYSHGASLHDNGKGLSKVLHTNYGMGRQLDYHHVVSITVEHDKIHITFGSGELCYYYPKTCITKGVIKYGGDNGLMLKCIYHLLMLPPHEYGKIGLKFAKYMGEEPDVDPETIFELIRQRKG
jgi:hypothetical protein